MSRTSYRDKATAIAALGAELRAAGWTLFGYHEDQSDGMTDYYSPARWDGVATKEGAVLVVGVQPGAHVLTYSGAGPRKNVWSLAPCEDCDGTKVTTRATTQTRETGKSFLGGLCKEEVVSVVVPAGAPCTRCDEQGMTKQVTRTEIPVTWPTFRANGALRTSWHVERDGKVIEESGVGLAAAHKAKKLGEVVAAIERAARGGSAGELEAPKIGEALALGTPPDWLKGAKVTRSTIKPDYAEVRFDAKPAEAVRAHLKDVLRFRWARSTQCWYGPSARLTGDAGVIAAPKREAIIIAGSDPDEYDSARRAHEAAKASPETFLENERERAGERMKGFALKRPMTLAEGREASYIEAHHGIPADSGATEVPWPAD